MMLHTIGNQFLSVSVNEMGAELWSILGCDGTQYLWQGDPRYWKDRALTIFPYVARLTQGRYVMDGQEYEMPIHGFAPHSRFHLIHKSEDSMTFELRSSEETLCMYPRNFAFRVVYALSESTLSVRYEIENCDQKTMYFGLGGHPGFNVPLEQGLCFEDYVLRFERPCTPVRVGFSEDCFVNGQDVPFNLEDDRILPLSHKLFDDDAIVISCAARKVTLESPCGKRAITVSYPDMPYLGIWHWPHTDAPYVCIEPWRSLPSKKDKIAVFEQQKDLVALEAGKTYINTWTIACR